MAEPAEMPDELAEHAATADAGSPCAGSPSAESPCSEPPCSEPPCARQILPLIDHLARLGRRAAGSWGEETGCLRPRHLIAIKVLIDRGPMGQHALGEALSLDPSNVVGLLNELEDRGLITRRRDPADRRRHIVELSPSGQSEATASAETARRVEDDLLRALSPAERTTLYDLLSRAVGGVMSSPCGPGAASPCDGG